MENQPAEKSTALHDKVGKKNTQTLKSIYYRISLMLIEKLKTTYVGRSQQFLVTLCEEK